jgi:hypothetical protein
LFIAILLCAGSLLSGCAGVQPWEREYLASPIMRLDADREQKGVREHFLATREGSVGSFGVSGGGCGCN